MKAIYQRVKALVFQPRQTWEAIDDTVLTTRQLILSTLLPLAAIPAIAFFIGYSISGVRIPFAGVYRMAWWQSLITALVGYGVTVANVWLLGVSISKIGVWFGAAENPENGLKAAVFSYSPFLAAGVLYIIPNLGIVVTLIGLYACYLLYLGVPRLMHPPENRTVLYSILSVMVAIVLYTLFNQITQLMLNLFGPDLPSL